MNPVYLVRGTILFKGNEKISNAKIRVILYDTTDESKKVAENEVEYDSKSLSIFKYLPFELKNFDMDKDRKYSLFVHIDQNGDGNIKQGDYVSFESYPVKTGLEEFDITVDKFDAQPAEV